ncbi:MAG: hypothetical protein A2W09_03215 [Deltaproteobacteria bacterium RBG_16_50_11]|nr:MAG: hypothetical protein A2W09_03215 [Deltaproteobacteria bacterium RBG_16_50_11]
MDDQGKTWLGLDTSIKAAGYTYNTPPDILSEYSLLTMRDDYLGTTQTQTPLEYIKTKINEYLSQNHPGKTYTDYLSTKTLVPEVMQILPGSMQFNQVKITNEYTQIPDELIHTVKFTATNPQLETNNELFTITLPVYRLSNQKIAITYEPETVEDQEIIDEYGGLDNTPSYLVHLRPALKVNDERVAVGIDGLAMGADYDLSIELHVPGYESAIEKITNTMIVGNLSVIGISAQKTITLAAVPEQDKDAERILYEEAIKYIDRWNKAENELASLMRLTIARPIPTVLMVGGVIDVTYLLDTPQGYAWKGAFIDADLRTIETVTSDESRVKNFMQISSLQGSVLENRIFEDDFQVGSISTAKLLQLANAQPVTILAIDQANISTILPTLTFDQNIKDDISASVAEGLTVRIPQSELTYENWTGIGYIKENPTTGESGWMLSGSIAGGMTAWSIDRWPTIIRNRLANANSEPPNYDPASATSIQKITATDLQDGIAGKKLSTPLQVEVRDEDRNPVEGVNVTFTIKAGGGTLSGKGPDGLPVSGAAISVPTNSLGIASADLTLGQKTSDNPKYREVSGAPYKQQIGENITDAALPSGTTVTTPFTAYASPDNPDHMEIYGDGSTTTILSFSGYASVIVVDSYGNPYSNLPVAFEALSAMPNETCAIANKDDRSAQLVKTTNACIFNAPVWGECQDAATQLTEKTSSEGATVEVILGGTPNARYPITATCTDTKCQNPATNEFINATITHNTVPFGNCAGNQFPQDQFVLKTVELVDAKGGLINAGKVMTNIPVMARIYFIREGETTKGWTYTCQGQTVNCDLRIGDRSYEIDTAFDNTATSVTFAGQPGTSQGNGIYAGTYTLPALPGEYTVSINATAKAAADSWSLYIGCTECSYPAAPLTGSLATTKQVYGVDITLDPVPTIFVDANGYTQRDHVISYTITPVQYQAMNASVKVYKFQPPSLEPQLVLSIPTERQNRGWATLARGMWFDKNSTYQVEVVLNDGAGTEMRSGKVNLTVTDIWVWITGVDTPCDNLVTPNPCVDSFIAMRPVNNVRPGDSITITAQAKQHSTDISSQITWTCTDAPADDIDSGTCSISTGAMGPTITFIPNPPPADTGRTKPLAYQVKAQITVEGQTYEDIKIIKQDNLDELRQEYEDLPERVSQTRGQFDNEAAPTEYPRLLDQPDIENGRHQWHILKTTGLSQHAIATDDKYSGNLSVTCGYRCPIANEALISRGAARTSNHQYGEAIDFNQNPNRTTTGSIENYNAFDAAYRADARVDSYLKATDEAGNVRTYRWSVPPPLPDQLPSGYLYVQGHVAWE